MFDNEERVINIKYTIEYIYRKLSMIDGFECINDQSIQLVSHVTKIPIDHINNNLQKILTKEQLLDVKEYLLLNPVVPVPYYLGYSIVNNTIIKVKKNITLLPGTETKKLIDIILSLLPSKKNSSYIDTATGSGVVAVCVALNNTKTRIIATDISKDALIIAKENIILHRLGKRINLQEGSWLDNLVEMKEYRNNIDIISANPPYVKSGLISSLPEGFIKYTPELSINGGDDGLTGFKHVIEQACELLTENGKLVLQTDEQQADAVGRLIEKTKKYRKFIFINGSRNIKRFVVAFK